MKAIFRKYSALDHLDTAGLLRVHLTEGLSNVDWVVTEKVHGANFSFHLDAAGAITGCAKRTAILRESDIFFRGWQDMRDRYAVTMHAVGVLVGSPCVVFGELFGGGGSGSIRVQKGITYTPLLEFYLFDIWDPVNETFLDWSRVEEICTAVCFPFHAEALASGTLEEVMNFDVNIFATRLNRTDDQQAVAEGVIIRPTQEIRSPNKKRFLFKKKPSQWSVNKDRKYPKTLWGKTTREARRLGNGVTQMRLQSVLSKEGCNPYPGTYRDLLDAFVTDILEENDNTKSSIDPSVLKFLYQSSSGLLWPRWSEIQGESVIA